MVVQFRQNYYGSSMFRSVLDLSQEGSVKGSMQEITLSFGLYSIVLTLYAIGIQFNALAAVYAVSWIVHNKDKLL